MKEPLGSRSMRLGFAYLIGLNVFGLVTALAIVAGSLLKMMPAIGFVGLVAGLGLGVLAGWRTEKALERLVQ